MRALRIVSFVGLGVFACSDPYSGGAPGLSDAGSGDGTAPTTPDSATDGAIADGAADAAVSCGWVALADSFESGAISPSWSRVTDGSTLSIGIGAASTARGSGSLGALIVTDGEGKDRHDYLDQVLAFPAGAPAPTCGVLSFALLADAITGPGVGIAALVLANDTAVTVWLEPTNQIQLVAQSVDGAKFESLLALPLSYGAWHTIRVRQDAGASSPSMSVDGQTGVVATPSLELGVPTKISIGVNFARAQTQARYWLDDVEVR